MQIGHDSEDVVRMVRSVFTLRVNEGFRVSPCEFVMRASFRESDHGGSEYGIGNDLLDLPSFVRVSCTGCGVSDVRRGNVANYCFFHAYCGGALSFEIIRFHILKLKN